jgi:hypothetical protein
VDYLVKIKPAQTRLSGQYWIGANSVLSGRVFGLARAVIIGGSDLMQASSANHRLRSSTFWW